MSYVTICKIQANGDVEEFAEGSNNHTFAPVLWEILGTKHGYLDKDAHPYFLMDPGMTNMWSEWPSPRMTRFENLLLGVSFDRVWVKRELLPEVIEALEWFLREHIRKPHKSKDWSTGLMVDAAYDSRTLAGDATESIYKRIGMIAALKQIYEDPTARGAAFNMCSANSSFWFVYDVPMERYEYETEPPCEKCQGRQFHLETCEDHEFEARPWNIDKDTEGTRGSQKGKKPWELSEGLIEPEISLP